MITEFLIGGVLIALTVIFQAICFDVIMRYGQQISTWFAANVKFSWKAFFITGVVLAVMTVGVVQMWMWALLYYSLTVIKDLETAVYFSVSSFTTVGFGDVVLPHGWRLLSSIEAANGFVLFGWSAAFIFEIVSNLYRREAQGIQNKQ